MPQQSIFWPLPPWESMFPNAQNGDWFSELYMPPGHVKISVAGEGMSGKAYYTLPEERCDLQSYANGPTLRQFQGHLRVVKIFTERLPNSFQAEVAALKLIEEKGGRLARRCVEIFEAHAGIRPYIVTKPILGPKMECVEFVPSYMLFHFFIQLTEALHFLHTMQPTCITHGDIHPTNIILDMSTQDFRGLPNLVLIDFASSDISLPGGLHTRRLITQDVLGMLKIVQDFIYHRKIAYEGTNTKPSTELAAEVRNVEDFYEFCSTVRNTGMHNLPNAHRQTLEWRDFPSTDSIWSFWGGRATAARAEMPQVIPESVKRHLSLPANYLEEDVERAIRKANESPSESPSSSL